MRRGPRTKARGAQLAKERPAAALASGPYEIEMTPSAKAVYVQLYQNMKKAEAKGEQSSSHHTIFRMVEDAVKYIIPRDPIKRMHGLSGPLSNLFRLKKGRHRICWAASSATRRVCILFISETLRKEGDANDPYNVFTKLVLAGEFDEIIGRLREP